MGLNPETVMQYVLHIVASRLMLPVMVILLLLVVFALVCVGWTVAEFLVERRHFEANTARDVNDIHDAPYASVPAVVAGTSLLVPQKCALEMVANNMGLPEGDLLALARAEVQAVGERYQRRVKVTDLVTKIGPMMGLMCTLIPLGPGIVAMSGGDLDTLSTSLLVAFDGTVAGMVAAVVSMVVSAVRRRWYRLYMSTLEALADCLLEKAASARAEGVALPCGFTAEDLVAMRRSGFVAKGAPKAPARAREEARAA